MPTHVALVTNTPDELGGLPDGPPSDPLGELLGPSSPSTATLVSPTCILMGVIGFTGGFRGYRPTWIEITKKKEKTDKLVHGTLKQTSIAKTNY